MIVLDASVAVDLLLGLEPHAAKVRRLVDAEAPNIAAPHLIDVEVAQVLRRLVMRRQLEARLAVEAIEDLADFPMTRYGHTLLVPRAFDLRGNITAYDAVYIALAESLQATLVTRDAALAHAPGHRARVRLIE